MATVSAQRLATIFVEVADTMVDDFDVIDFLQLLTDRAASLVDAAAVGIVLADPQGRLEFRAGSSESVKLLGLVQLRNHEGPCLEAYQGANPVINVDLGAAGDRLPRFAPRATELGFRSVHAFPLRLRHRVIGVLNVFGATTGGDLHDTDVTIMQALTDVAAIALIQEQAIHHGDVLTGQLQGALNSRTVIEQAKGMVAHARGISVDDAFAQLRRLARSHNRRLTDVAHTIVADPATAQRLS
jgi:GAF domain-containing protein